MQKHIRTIIILAILALIALTSVAMAAPAQAATATAVDTGYSFTATFTVPGPVISGFACIPLFDRDLTILSPTTVRVTATGPDYLMVKRLHTNFLPGALYLRTTTKTGLTSVQILLP